MRAPPPVLEARHLRRTADGGAILLDDVSVAFPAGSSTALVGPPGSGKTLLLRALGLLDPLQGGEVLFQGEAVADRDVPRVRRQVMLLQQRPILVEGSVRTNLELPFQFGQASEASFDESKAIDQLVRLGRSADFLDRDVSDLSGGESQVVALLRALQLDPTALLLDEPTASLDARTTAAVEKLITERQVGRGQRTLIIVTHGTDQARRMADRIVRIEQGRIAAD